MHGNGMVEHPGDPVDDRQTQPEPAFGLAGSRREALELHENVAEVLLRDARAGIPDLDA